MTADPIVYLDQPPHRRVVDLRPDGVDSIPLLGLSDFKSFRHAPALHVHPGCLEACLCLKGNLAFLSEDREYPFLPGTVFVSTPKQPHRLRHNPKGLRLYRLLFAFPKPGRRTLGLSARETEWLARSLAHLPKRVFAATDDVRKGFDDLFALYDGERRGSPARCVKMKAAALALLVALVAAARKTPGRPARALEETARLLRAHPEDDYTVDELAARCALAPVAFSEKFKRATGLPPHAYLIDCRIRAAARLLRTTARSVESIAGALRFSSSKHFATTFKRTLGKTPSEWRRGAVRSS